MKILSIGNSFSQDAHKWLNKLATQNGNTVETVNLYIGGCSLEQHYKNATEDRSDYDFERNGGAVERKISINDALKADKWDAVTLQQASRFSGMPQTFEPYITELYKTIKEYQPQARILFHQTWSYEIDFPHDAFAIYNNDQREMYRRICDTSQMVAKLINAEIIPTGTVIQKLREDVPEFDYKNGGASLCRDGYHLSWDYGRFAAAATWLRVLTGEQIGVNEFENFNQTLVQKIIATVNNLL